MVRYCGVCFLTELADLNGIHVSSCSHDATGTICQQDNFQAGDNSIIVLGLFMWHVSGLPKRIFDKG